MIFVVILLNDVTPGKLFVVYDRALLDAEGKITQGIVGMFVNIYR
jgi:hypothetical protein